MLLIPLARGTTPVDLAFLGAQQIFGDGFSVAFVIQAVTLRQTVLPRHLLGRANAAIHVCTAGLVPITAVLAGALAQATTIRSAVWVGTAIGPGRVGPAFRSRSARFFSAALLLAGVPGAVPVQ